MTIKKHKNMKMKSTIRLFLAVLVMLISSTTARAQYGSRNLLVVGDVRVSWNDRGTVTQAVAVLQNCEDNYITVTVKVKPDAGYYTRHDLITFKDYPSETTTYTPNSHSGADEVVGTDEKTISYIIEGTTVDGISVNVSFVGIGNLELKSNLGTNAGVTFYDGGTSAPDPTTFDPTSYTADDAIAIISSSNRSNNDHYIIAHVVPNTGYWTNEALLYGKELYDVKIASGPIGTRSMSIDGTNDVTLLQADEDRYDGAGWYCYKIPKEHFSDINYTASALEGFLVPKFDLSTATVSSDGKTYTVTQGDWSTSIETDGKTSFAYNGSGQAPQITSTTITAKRGTITPTFSPVDKQVTMVVGGGEAVNVGSYTATLTAMTTAASATTAAVSTGIFINSRDIPFSITKKDMNTDPTGNQNKMTVKVNPTSFIYNGTKQVPEVKVYDGEGDNAKEIPATEYDVSYKYKSDGTAVTDPTKAAVYTIVISDKAGKTNGNYNIVGGTAEFEITAKEVGLSWDKTSFTYDTQAQQPVATVTGLVTVNGQTDACKVTTYKVEAKDGSSLTDGKAVNVGNYKVTATALDNANYKLPSAASTDFIIDQEGTFTISFDASIADEYYIYDGTAKEPAVVVKDGDITLKKDQDYEVVYENNINAGENTASVKVTAKGNFKGSKTAKFSIKPAELTVTAKAKTIGYGSEASNNGVEFSGFVDGESETTAGVFSGTLAYTYNSKEDGTGSAYTKESPVGTYYIIPSGLTSGNYAITYKAGVLTVDDKMIVIGGEDDDDANATVSVSPTEFTYNGKDQKPEVKITLKDGNKDIPATEYDVKYKDAKGTAMSDTKNAGTYTLEIANKAGADYAFSGKTTANYTIKQKALTVTAKAKTIGYGSEASNNGVEYSGFAEGESESTAGVFSGTLAYAYNSKEDGTGSAYTKESPVGTYYIIPSGLTSGNYAITYKAGVLTVSDKVIVIGGDDDTDADATISVKPTEFIYNGKDQKPEVTITLKDVKTVISASEYEVKYKDAQGTAVTETKNAGTYTLEITNKEGADYAFSGKTTANYTIKPAELKVTAEAQTKKVGEADPALTYTYKGLVDGDKITGALTRDAGEAAGSYAIKLGTLTAGTNYAITFTGANLTITDDSSAPEDPTYYKITVVKTEGGKVNSTHVKATVGQQVNLVVIPDEGYEMSSLVVVNNSAKTSVSTGITYDKDSKPFNYFLMPASDVTVTAIFQKVKQDKDFKQNIFIFRNPYGEVVSNLLYAESGQQVNLETRIKDGFTNVVLDDLYVINEKGEQLQLFYLVDPIEGPVHLFFMRGEKAYVFNSFKGTNGIVDDSNPLPLDMDYVLYLINNIFGSNFLNLNNGAEGVQVAMSLLANLLANVTTDGELSVNKGPEDLLMALLNLKSGWKIKIDFTGIIQLLNPELLGLGKGATLTSGQIYELLTPGNLQLLLNSSYGPLLIKSITVIAPDSETDPTAINGLKADGAAGKIYDLRGRKMDTTNLRKGIYIRDGKKVVIK